MASSSSGSTSNMGKILKRANPSTIQDKFIVGYQGWFTCPGDGDPIGPGHHGWLHWFNYPILDGGHPNIDLWPDVSAYPPSELFPAPGLKTKTGEPVFLFSSRNAKTVQRHFHWMAEHGVDGVFLQRFAGQCDLEAGNEGIRRIRDEVGGHVREAAEREGRVFAIMYDVSGVASDRIQRVLERDWVHIVRNQDMLDSPNYLKEKGKPVIALWGFGFDGAGHTPDLVRTITQFFRNTTPGGVYIVGGSPASWRTAEGDADRNPGFMDVWMNDFDAISPWTIGRYETEQDADRFCEVKLQGDFDLIKRHNEEGRGRKVDYIPVVFPGGSGYNSSEGKWGFNNIKRHGGRFLWKQISNAKRLGVRTIYGAMWDEYDEGTAFMPVVEHKRLLPESDKFRFMALDEDGHDCPADWYMRICGFAAEGLRSERRIHETFPVKELQDYWSSRPKYEAVPDKSGDFVSGSSAITDDKGSSNESGKGSGGGDGQTYQEWLAAQKDEKEEVPPPPYSLEADELASPTASPAVVAPAPAQPVLAQLTVVSTAAPVSVAAEVPTASQPPSTTTSVPQATPQIALGTSIANSGTYLPYGGLPQQFQPAGPSYGGQAQTQQYPPAANTTTMTPTTYQQNQPHPQAQDLVASLAQDYGRQSISGPSRLESVGGPPVDGRVPGGSPPPQHPSRPPSAAANANLPYATGPVHHGRPSRPQTPQGHSRPQSQQRPPAQTSHYNSRPQSQQGYHHHHHQHQLPGAATALANAAPQTATHGASSQVQWPPLEWGTNSAANPGPSASTVSHSTYPAYPNQPQPPAHGAGSGPPAPVGANLSRPQTFSASSYGGANLRPHASLSARPSNTTTTPGSFPVPPVAENPSPSSGYPGPNPYNASFGGGPPQPTVSSYTPAAPTTGVPLQYQGHGSLYGAPSLFNMPSPSPYLPPFLSTYPGQSTGPSTYPTSNYGGGWPGGPPPSSHASPPHSPPGGVSTFPGQSGYGNNPLPYSGPAQGPPSQSHYPGGPSFPQTHQPSALGGPGGSGGGSPFFPQGPSGDGGYFNSTGTASSMPSSTPPYPPSGSGSSMYAGQQSSYPGQGAGGGASSYPQAASPWIPSGPSSSSASMPPVMPTRPQTGPSQGPSFPMASTTGSGAYGMALSAFDKYAGKKTREQLEAQVGNLAQTGSKLFNKFTK